MAAEEMVAAAMRAEQAASQVAAASSVAA